MLGCFDSLLYFRAPAHQYLPGKPSGADFLIHLSKLEPQMNKCSTETQSLTVPIQIIFTNKYLLQTVLNLCQDSACSTYQKAKTIEILQNGKGQKWANKITAHQPIKPAQHTNIPLLPPKIQPQPRLLIHPDWRLSYFTIQHHILTLLWSDTLLLRLDRGTESSCTEASTRLSSHHHQSC